MAIVYGTFEAAEHRVQALRRSGIWPGIICRHDGLYSLTYDPGDTEDSR